MRLRAWRSAIVNTKGGKTKKYVQLHEPKQLRWDNHKRDKESHRKAARKTNNPGKAQL
mgnify:CR=1 FL=1